MYPPNNHEGIRKAMEQAAAQKTRTETIERSIESAKNMYSGTDEQKTKLATAAVARGPSSWS